MIEMKVTGIKETILKLRNIGDLVDINARKTMHRAADRIVELAKKMAPVDEGNLEESITAKVTYEGPKRRLAIDVYMKPEVNGVNVEAYATRMHEGSYKLGPKSQIKQAGQSEVVGPGFLTRAAEPEAQKFAERMLGAIKEVIEK
jgi:hypothetical protein